MPAAGASVFRLLKYALVLYIPVSFTLLPPPSTFHFVIGYTGAVLTLFFAEVATRTRGALRLWNVLNALAAAIPTVYFLAAVERLSMPLGQPPPADYVLGFFLLIAVVEASRQALDWVMPALVVLLLGYVVFGPWMPGILFHPGVSFSRTIFQLTASLAGPYGDIPTIIIEVVLMFLVFGAVVQGAGIADFFGSLTQWISGRVRSGAGLTAVSMSSLFGAITGAPIANVGTTGAFTIPLMRRAGFTPEQAAAIEGVASTGSQIIPPILGTSAFLMAQFLNKPYSHIAAASLVPAALFILCLMLTVHGLGMLSNTRRVELPPEQAARWSKAYLLLPVIALIIALVHGFSPQYSAFVATVATFAMYAIELLSRGHWRGGRRGLREAAAPMLGHIEATANSMIMVVIAGAVIGVLVTLLTIPLTIQRISSAAIEMSGGNVTLILAVIAVASILLGTGLPTVATYVLVVLLFAPTVIQLGVEPLAAHMFVFYLGVAADISPPVAMAVLAACGIAQANFWRASWLATKIGAAFFVIPVLFIVQPGILRLPADAESWLTLAAVTVGLTAITGGLCGYLFGYVPPVLRLALIGLGIVAMWPGVPIAVPLVAMGAFALCVLWVRRAAKGGRTGAPT